MSASMSNRIPFILVPSLLCDARLWQNQVKALENIADCTTPLVTQYDDIAAIARHILDHAPHQFALAGLSMGGYVALEIIRQAPSRVLKLALLNTSARADTPAQVDHRRVTLAAARIGQFKGVTPRLLPTLIHPDRINDNDLTSLIIDMAQTMGREAFFNQQTAIMNRPDSRDLLKAVTCPTLAIGGAQDMITPPELMREIAAGVKGARLEIIEKCGHLAALEWPGTVNSLMRAWLSA